jgi:hypothetical protein
MTNKLLLTTILSVALWANSFAQCTSLSGNNVKQTDVDACLTACGCNSIEISSAIGMNGNWAFLSATTITIKAGGSLDFKGNTITMPTGSSIVIAGGSIASNNPQTTTRIIINNKGWLGSQFGSLITAGGTAFLSPLPVELVAFNGVTGATGNLLHWETAEETNFSHFDMERSANGQTFTKISQVKAKGSNSEYGFLDENPAHNLYYRLKINDIDGSFNYSDVIALQASRPNVVEIYPTITQDAVTLVAENTESIVQIMVSDMFGKVVIVANGLNNNRLDLSELTAGMYLVQWQIGGEIQSAKVFKK